MTKKYDVYGIGNGIMDVLLSVPDELFNQLGLTRGGFGLVDTDTQLQLLEKLKVGEPTLASGGSAANTIITVAALGAKTAFSCCLADDHYGNLYRNEFNRLGITLNNDLREGGITGSSIVLVTPDAERTMNTALGTSADFGPDDVSEEQISQSKWVYIEGYLMANPGGGQAAVRKTVELAKKHNTKIAVTFSDSFVISAARDFMEEVVLASDLIFANEGEAMTFTQTKSKEDAFKQLTQKVASVAMTAGEHGAYISCNGEIIGNIPAFSCKPIDLTGAGDAFAGAILYGMASGKAPRDSAIVGCYIAMKVITQVGARWHGDIALLWNEALKN